MDTSKTTLDDFASEQGGARIASSVTGERDQLSTLLHMIAQGDESAFGQFYALTSGRAYGIARRVIRDPELSEDIMQEV
ncbi:hypothetical protein [Arthrobacter sp. A5]|uniref:hypothetical protein n=1 Tax=Arthrobacter sp. A5 TaxID=576926 RepID=UPI003DA7BF09